MRGARGGEEREGREVGGRGVKIVAFTEIVLLHQIPEEEEEEKKSYRTFFWGRGGKRRSKWDNIVDNNT